MIEAYRLIDKLGREHALSLLEYQTLIEAEMKLYDYMLQTKRRKSQILYMGIQSMYVA